MAKLGLYLPMVIGERTVAYSIPQSDYKPAGKGREEANEVVNSCFF